MCHLQAFENGKIMWSFQRRSAAKSGQMVSGPKRSAVSRLVSTFLLPNQSPRPICALAGVDIVLVQETECRIAMQSVLVRLPSVGGIARTGSPRRMVSSARVRCQRQPQGNAPESKVQEACGVFQMIPQRGEATLLNARCTPTKNFY